VDLVARRRRRGQQDRRKKGESGHRRTTGTGNGGYGGHYTSARQSGLAPPTRPAYIPWPIMVFSSPIFLFAFLPFALAAYFVAPRRLRNVVLLAFSLAFYASGEPRHAWL